MERFYQEELTCLHIIAHRGASAYAPENTFAAFEKAVKLGADFIELDVQLTKDGKLAVIHDDKVDRTTNGTGFVREYTMNELEKLDAGSWFGPEFQGEKIPSLEAVLEKYQNKTGLLIEIKSSKTQPGIEKATGQLISRFDHSMNTIVQSFDAGAMRALHHMYPSIPAAVLIRPRFGMLPRGRLRQIASFARYVSLKATMVSPFLIKSIHSCDLKALAWTVNGQKTGRRLKSWKIDGIITDYPDYF
ncbi:glycerophosphodiester phosphodiesterase [Bacillus haynesii]|uniref:glycerophosphodiester phosphodiesterase n=1 Tax=Bacillus haynesii TaxID=1925021 RepID=UPI001C2307A0|nr:glycerophosphodiester phosphodiesterase family protein [Bacillus haynesii]MBU8683098.1 glycerophosphodiester phosphodiesterase [Bacillus haynesii]MCY8354458.1 glycerophosphodiester phosphodiesterase [Bacillus haynesii]MCY8665874.1 glycerophosphodiester phosphodiesterase [Bacillus haynesii]MCY9157552.1 glycerophosphodiester phosphodiesterase [Bacillus haynesii]